MISTLATGYLFLGGSGAGALCLLSLMEWLRTCRKHSFGCAVLPEEFFSRSWLACLFCLALGAVFLLFDLGSVDALLYLLISPQPAALTVGAFSLPISIVCASAFLFINVLEGTRVSYIFVRILSIVGIVFALITMSYTGVLLQDMAAVLAWRTILVPILFVLSSLSCGIALLLGSMAFVETRLPFTEFIAGLLKMDSFLIVLELLAIATFIVVCMNDDRTVEAVHALLSGVLAPQFWIGLIGFGLVLPFVMEYLVTYSSHRHQLLFIAAAILVGGLMMRCCIVGLAQFDPAQEIASAQYVLQTSEKS